MKVRISHKEIKLGQAVPWNLYNAEGRILFRRGFMVHTNVALKKLSSLELYRDTEESGRVVAPGYDTAESASVPRSGESRVSAPAAAHGMIDHHALRDADFTSVLSLDNADNVFEVIRNCAVFLKQFYEAVNLGEPTLVADFNTLVKHLMRLQVNRPDECLAAIHLYYRLPQSLLQPIYAALLCKIYCDLAYIEPDHIEPLLAAALTANLGMYHYYDRLVTSTEKLSPQQKMLINTHSLKSLMLLKGIGITDRVWLEVVEQHHERGDGSGYPKGVLRDDIRVEASIYGLADSYLGLIMPRAFRPRIEPLDAWQRLSKFNVAEDDEILGLFLQYAGIYPPGSVVELKNNEIAVVLNRDKEGISPTVVAFGDRQGNQIKDIKIRHTDQPEYGIVGAFAGQLPTNADLAKIYMIGRSISAVAKR